MDRKNLKRFVVACKCETDEEITMFDYQCISPEEALLRAINDMDFDEPLSDNRYDIIDEMKDFDMYINYIEL